MAMPNIIFLSLVMFILFFITIFTLPTYSALKIYNLLNNYSTSGVVGGIMAVIILDWPSHIGLNGFSDKRWLIKFINDVISVWLAKKFLWPYGG